METSGQTSFNVSIPIELEAQTKLNTLRYKGISAQNGGSRSVNTISDACCLILWAAIRNGLVTEQMMMDELKRLGK